MLFIAHIEKLIWVLPEPLLPAISIRVPVFVSLYNNLSRYVIPVLDMIKVQNRHLKIFFII
jgi:hypothetical protein